MASQTGIEGPRSTHVLFSTGRVAELRTLPSFRAMKREGLLDDKQVFALQALFDGALVNLDAAVEDALLRHVFIDPPLCRLGLGVLDDSEVQEAVTFAITAFLSARAVAEPDEEIADEDLPVGADPFADEEVPEVPVDIGALQAEAEAAILAREPDEIVPPESAGEID